MPAQVRHASCFVLLRAVMDEPEAIVAPPVKRFAPLCLRNEAQQVDEVSNTKQKEAGNVAPLKFRNSCADWKTQSAVRSM